jgi:hypothetical protein
LATGALSPGLEQIAPSSLVGAQPQTALRHRFLTMTTDEALIQQPRDEGLGQEIRRRVKGVNLFEHFCRGRQNF